MENMLQDYKKHIINILKYYFVCFYDESKYN